MLLLDFFAFFFDFFLPFEELRDLRSPARICPNRSSPPSSLPYADAFDVCFGLVSDGAPERERELDPTAGAAPPRGGAPDRKDIADGG